MHSLVGVGPVVFTDVDVHHIAHSGEVFVRWLDRSGIQ